MINTDFWGKFTILSSVSYLSSVSFPVHKSEVIYHIAIVLISCCIHTNLCVRTRNWVWRWAKCSQRRDWWPRWTKSQWLSIQVNQNVIQVQQSQLNSTWILVTFDFRPIVWSKRESEVMRHVACIINYEALSHTVLTAQSPTYHTEGQVPTCKTKHIRLTAQHIRLTNSCPQSPTYQTDGSQSPTYQMFHV